MLNQEKQVHELKSLLDASIQNEQKKDSLLEEIKISVKDEREKLVKQQ